LTLNLRELSIIADMDEALSMLARVDLVRWPIVGQPELVLVDRWLEGRQERVHAPAPTGASQADVEEMTQVRLRLADARRLMATLLDALDVCALHAHECALKEQHPAERAHAAVALRDARASLGDFIRREEDVARCAATHATLEALRNFARTRVGALPPDFPDTPLVQSVLHTVAAHNHALAHADADFAMSKVCSADEDAAMLENALAAMPEPVQVIFEEWELSPVDLEHLCPGKVLCRIFPNGTNVGPGLDGVAAYQTRFILRTSAEFRLWRARGPPLHAFEHRFVVPAPAPHEDHEVAPRQKRLKAPVPDDSEAQLLALLHGLRLRFRDVVDFLDE